MSYTSHETFPGSADHFVDTNFEAQWQALEYARAYPSPVDDIRRDAAVTPLAGAALLGAEMAASEGLSDEGRRLLGYSAVAEAEGILQELVGANRSA